LHTKPQNLAILVAVIALAVALTFAASGGAVARSTFQSSIEPPPDSTATFTPEPIFTPPASDFPTITPFVPETLPPPTIAVELTPTLPVVSEATPTVSSFLPPPTLVNPSALIPGRLTPLAPENPPLVGPASPPESTPTPVPPQAPGAAELIDSGVVAFSYLWLCCGVVLVAVAGLVVLWLWRRSKRR
jgi:hypothetical protein